MEKEGSAFPAAATSGGSKQPVRGASKLKTLAKEEGVDVRKNTQKKNYGDLDDSVPGAARRGGKQGEGADLNPFPHLKRVRLRGKQPPDNLSRAR